MWITDKDNIILKSFQSSLYTYIISFHFSRLRELDRIGSAITSGGSRTTWRGSCSLLLTHIRTEKDRGPSYTHTHPPTHTPWKREQKVDEGNNRSRRLLNERSAPRSRFSAVCQAGYAPWRTPSPKLWSIRATATLTAVVVGRWGRFLRNSPFPVRFICRGISYTYSDMRSEIRKEIFNRCLFNCKAFKKNIYLFWKIVI